MADPVGHLVGFGRRLRRAGLPVGTGRILSFCRATAVLAPIDRKALYWAARITLVAHPDHFETFDREFNAYFRSRRLQETLRSMFEAAEASAPKAPNIEVLAADELAQVEGALEGDDAEEGMLRLIASPTEVLREKSFDQLSEAERDHAYRLIRRLAVTLPARRSRRMTRALKGDRFDLRRTLRSSFKTHGEPVERAWRRRRNKPRSLVLILDISGSMASYARALMQFGYAALAAGTRVEVFCFGTRLTRVTRVLRGTDPDRALAAVTTLVADWSGGTRIGASLKQLLDSHSQSSFLKGAVVVLCSDGLERGEPEVLAVQIARLRRIAHRIVWVNPLKGDPRYEPLARGMAAALPYVDDFMPGHNLASLEELGEVVVRA